MVNEQQATAWRAATNADRLGAAGLEFLPELGAGDEVLLPVVHIWTLLAVNCHIGPVAWQRC